ncbi:hypothetical protein E8E15_000211 [Penicillium rubens]|nr:hypothetical protein E8E15_000211 [Penicillium rubens]
MTIPPRSMTVIDDEFQRLEGIEETCFDEDVMTFLQDAQATLKYKGIYNLRGPFKRSLIHYAAMGDCAELLLYLLQDGTAKDDLDHNKRTPLSWAAQYGALRAVKLLLDNGVEGPEPSSHDRLSEKEWCNEERCHTGFDQEEDHPSFSLVLYIVEL